MLKIKNLILMLGLMGLLSCQQKNQNLQSYNDYPVIPEADLWPIYTPDFTIFSIWSPVAEEVRLNLYKKGSGGKPYKVRNLQHGEKGLWTLKINRDMKNYYYTYQVKINGAWLAETPGIYAKAVGVNGNRAMVVDMNSTNPEGWEQDKGPELNKPNEAVIYELHLRDLTSHPNSGSSFPGKYLGLVEKGTQGPKGIKTGIDHLKDLGVTHVHLLPAYDHYSIDETKLDSAQFNWGYDPQNYNVPEGSFSSDPYNAGIRIKEFKEMVKQFHDNGIGVILDVVYNHTGRTENSNFNLELPGYYYRQNPDGSYSDASACGNETASERTMMRKFMVESVLYWAKEYHLDGFRFDLMGIHDIETMNHIASALKKLNPNIFVYGEGWTASNSPLPENQQALKKYCYKMKYVSAFSDDIRDGIKGSVFEDESLGFVSGGKEKEESIKFGVVGSIHHDQIDYSAVIYSDSAWSNEPWEAVNYVSCHDNHTLFDKLIISTGDTNRERVDAMNRLANAIVLTSQGIPFLHAGVEMQRTKSGDHNSYNKPDSINQIDWNWKIQNEKVYQYYKKLIHLRKKHPAFFMPESELVRDNLVFIAEEPGFIGFMINGEAVDDTWTKILVYYNASSEAKNIELEGKWGISAYEDKIDETGLMSASGRMNVPSLSMMIAFQKN